MIIGRIILLFLVFVSVNGFSQKKFNGINNFKETYSLTTKSFGKKEGFIIKEYKASIVDNFGTLWVGGTVEKTKHYQLNNKSIGLFFFNGTKFQEFPFPDSLKQYNTILLDQGVNNELLVTISNKEKLILLLINPMDLTYKEIKQPFEIETGHIGNFAKTFTFNEQPCLLTGKDNKVNIHRLNKDNSFELINEFNLGSNKEPYYPKIYPTNKYIILNDFHSGVYLLQVNKNKIIKLSSKDLGINLSKEIKINIFHRITFKGTPYYKFNLSDNYYSFEENTTTWKVQDGTQFPFNAVSKEGLLFSTEDSPIFNIKDKEGSKALNIFDQNEYKMFAPIPLDEFSFSVETNSRDYSKEVFLFSQNNLMQIQFKKKKVNSFLKKYSIRSIQELPENKVLVGTELNGLFEVNLSTGEEKKYVVYLNDSIYSPTHNRGLYIDSLGVFTSNRSGICYIDKKSKKITCYKHSPISVFKDQGKSLFYGTKRFKLMRFDKLTRSHIPLASSKDLNMQDLLIKGDTIFSATHSGLFIYHSGSYEVVKIPNNNSQLLCLTMHPTLGLLAGSIDGNVYRYDEYTKGFYLVYSDELHTSIATILVDKNEDLWINSFKGYIHYSVKDSTHNRFGVQDGFSNNEANRLSALKLKNGNLLIGTLKGLNHFNPEELSKARVQSNLRFTEINYTDKNKTQRAIISPKELKNLPEIILAPENRNISLFFGFEGISSINKNLRYKYRLNKGEWRFVNEFGALNLVSLAPDRYLLEIIAVNKLEKEISSSIELTIIAKQFFYKTSWFWCLIVFIILSISVWIGYQHLKNQKLKQHFADKIINAHIEEQSQLSQKLHDSVGQKLLLAKNDFILNKKIPKEELTYMDEIISEVRNISHDLHPLQFEELGFKKSIENLVEGFQRNSDIFYSYELDCSASILPLEKEIILFGIIQECLNNVEKHSQAEACQVKIVEENKKLQINIKDNGKGFEVNKKAIKFSLGLKTMKERADYLDANLNFISTKNEGATVRINLKINT